MVIKSKRKKTGVTLVELVIATAILAIIASLGSVLYTQVRKIFFINLSRVAIQTESQSTHALIYNSLRQAQAQWIVITQNPGEPYYSRINFKDQNNQAMSFFQEGTELKMTVNGNTRTLTKNVNTLIFTLPQYDDLSTISFKLMLEKKTYGTETKTMGTGLMTVRVMNK